MINENKISVYEMKNRTLESKKMYEGVDNSGNEFRMKTLEQLEKEYGKEFIINESKNIEGFMRVMHKAIKKIR